ncbi:hypothetical protein BH10ACI1_BH10ACI1_07530 [soil metagenome]
MKMNPAKRMEKMNKILQAWRDLAPNERFAGMTIAEFETEINKSVTFRLDLTELENQITAKTQERDMTDETNWDLSQFVVDSVKGNRSFGQNSGLYEAMGYITKSERKSGLTKKKKNNGNNG